MINYLSHYSLDRDRFEARTLIESASVSIRHENGGDVYATEFIEDPSLTTEFYMTTDHKMVARKFFEIVEPSDIGGLVYQLVADSASVEAIDVPLKNWRFVTWTPYFGSGSYKRVNDRGEVDICPPSGFGYTYDGPVYDLTNQNIATIFGDGNFLWPPCGMVNHSERVLPTPLTVMIKYNILVNAGLILGGCSAGTSSIGGPIFGGQTTSSNNSLGMWRYGTSVQRRPYIGSPYSASDHSPTAIASHTEFDFAHTFTIDGNSICRHWDQNTPLNPYTSSATELDLRWLFHTSGSMRGPFASGGSGVQEICIWNRVLTDEEIIDLNNSYFYPKYKGIDQEFIP
jgi:hypothetical protein